MTTTDMKTSDSPLSPQQGESAPDWAALRGQFPTMERFAYLDNARKAVLPRSVEAAIGEWLADVYDRCGKDAFSMERVEDARRAVAGLIGAPVGTVALIKNTSEGINILAQGLGLKGFAGSGPPPMAGCRFPPTPTKSMPTPAPWPPPGSPTATDIAQTWRHWAHYAAITAPG
jgi:hypothetical protein